MKKGFTLVELLATIIILGIIAAISIAGIQTALTNSRKNAYDLVTSKITEKANDYINEANRTDEITASTPLDIALTTLITEKYITIDDLKDPRKTNGSIDKDTGFVRFSLSDIGIEYKFCENDTVEGCS